MAEGTNIILYRRYAKALFDLGIEYNQIDEVFEDMLLVRKVCDENSSLRAILKNFVIKNRVKENIIHDIFSGKISNLSLKFILFIIRKERANCLSGIANSFIKVYRDYKNITTVLLYTAEPADENIKERIISIVQRFTDSEINLVNEVDKKLIGGFRLIFDGNLYDASLFTKLQKLNKSFSVNVYEKSL